MDLTSILQLFSAAGKNPKPTEVRYVELPGKGRIKVVQTIECLNEICPRPQLLAIKALGQAEHGDVVELVSDNYAAMESIPSLMLVINCTHLMTQRRQGIWHAYMKKGFEGLSGGTQGH